MSMKATLLMYLAARPSSPFPLAIANKGAPPFPKRFWNAVITVIIGKASPTPVRAAAPAPGMCPRYILSTML